MLRRVYCRTCIQDVNAEVQRIRQPYGNDRWTYSCPICGTAASVADPVLLEEPTGTIAECDAKLDAAGKAYAEACDGIDVAKADACWKRLDELLDQRIHLKQTA